MERSQSCCNFEEKHTNSNTNPTPSLGNCPASTPTSANGRREHRRTKTKSSSAHNLRQLIDGRPHSSLMQQVHELKQQQQQQAEIHLLPRALHHHHHNLLPYSHKKSPLQRQKSTRSYAADEPDYSADLEDDEDYDYDDDDDRDDGDDDVIMAAPHAAKQLILPAAAGDLGAANHPATPQQVHRATLIIDTKLKHCSLQEIAVPRPRTPTTAASTPISTPTTTSPSPLHSTKTFRLPGHHHHKQLSLDLPPCSPSPSLSMFVQQHCRHHSAGTPDSGTCGSPLSLRRHNFSQLKRGNSLQSHSDSSSHYSSVDSLLESRKPDPEAILINLGFGPAGTEDILSRIPKRFLKPSQVRGIDTEAFVKRLQLANSLADHSALGYRGLTGNPDLPPSSIVAKIMQRFEVNERKKSMGSIETHMR